MGLKRIIGGAVGLLGGAAIVNRYVSRQVGPLGPPLERETGSYRWRGMEVAYTEGGDPEDPDMLLVHGIHAAGTSREFNRIFDRLAEDYHVFAPDLPGFGRSDRPPLTYTATLYESFLQDFIADLTDRPICVGSSLAGAYLADIAANADLERLVLVCPTDTVRTSGYAAAGAFLRLPLVGKATFNLLSSRRVMRRFLYREAVYDPDALSDEDISYFWETAHQPGARFAPASFIAGHLDTKVDLGVTLSALDLETTLIWGREAKTPSLARGREIADTADTKLVVLDQSKLLPHIEQAEPFLEILADELEVAE